MTNTSSVPGERFAISFEDVLAAAERLRGVANKTPVFTSRALDQALGAQVFLKCENFQRGGSFKFRGAYNRLSAMSEAERSRGVVAFSSGNHAQGVAMAARELGMHATIVMPTDAPASKVAATRGYGAEVVTYDRLTEDREAIARKLSDERGLILVPPYDHPLIMAGQGTAALELIDEVGGLNLIVAPVGGGGLLSGTVTAARGRSAATRVIGVETHASNDWELSLAAGKRIRIEPPDTIADGIRTQQPGELTFPIVSALAEGVMTVSEDEVKDAVRYLLPRLKLLVEPTGAVPFALVRSGRIPDMAGRRVGVILSGGNVDADVLARILTERP